MKLWIHSAVKPLLKLAKQHLSPLAGPISGEICFTFNVAAKWAPEMGASVRGCGPDTGRDGRFQAWEEGASIAMPVLFSGADLGEGAPPMMPPSMNFMGVGEKREAIERAVRGEMAFRSR